MGIPNRTIAENEQAEERRKDKDTERRQRVERDLERALEDTFPASDPVSVVQPRRAGGRRRNKAP
jgi:hypothetical protein